MACCIFVFLFVYLCLCLCICAGTLGSGLTVDINSVHCPHFRLRCRWCIFAKSLFDQNIYLTSGTISSQVPQLTSTQEGQGTWLSYILLKCVCTPSPILLFWSMLYENPFWWITFIKYGGKSNYSIFTLVGGTRCMKFHIWQKTDSCFVETRF